MRYVLDQNYRLRGWTDHLTCLECYPGRRIMDLSVREFGLLSKCDGLTDVDAVKYAEAIRQFTSMGIIREADGAVLDPAQKHLFYENRRFRKMDICITGCCDFRCRHCFNAEENERSRGTQPNFGQLEQRIFDGIRDGHIQNPPTHLFIRTQRQTRDKGDSLPLVQTQRSHDNGREIPGDRGRPGNACGTGMQDEDADRIAGDVQKIHGDGYIHGGTGLTHGTIESCTCVIDRVGRERLRSTDRFCRPA